MKNLFIFLDESRFNKWQLKASIISFSLILLFTGNILTGTSCLKVPKTMPIDSGYSIKGNIMYHMFYTYPTIGVSHDIHLIDRGIDNTHDRYYSVQIVVNQGEYSIITQVLGNEVKSVEQQVQIFKELTDNNGTVTKYLVHPRTSY